MRPRELTVEGFRSYRDRAVFDWRGRHLVGVVGPVGAGKSSILDAVAFALYGKTPTFERDTRSLIHQLADQCHVELVFEVDGQIWRAQRALRRKGQSGHRLERLAADEPGAEVVEIVTQERNVRDRVTALLGMDFSAFCRSVLLAQNRFAEFLRATAGQRNDVLKGVFGYERFDAALGVAKGRAFVAQAELEALEKEGAHLHDARTALEEVERQAKDATARRDRLQAAAARIEELGTRRGAAERDQADASAAFERLGEVRASMPTDEDLMRVTEAADRAQDEIDTAERAAEKAEERQRTAETELRAVAERVGDRSVFQAFALLVQRHASEAQALQSSSDRARTAAADLAEARAEVDAREAHAKRAVAALSRADETLADATGHLDLAEAALHEARHADMTGELRRSLVAGEPCPVCAQVVGTVPKAARARTVAAAEKARVAAVAGVDRARRARETATTELTRATERITAATKLAATAADVLAAAEETRRHAEADLAATKSELADRLGTGDPSELLEEREAELKAAEQRARETAEAAAAARSALDLVRRGGARAARELTGLAGKLQGAWGLLGRARDVEADPASVRDAFVAVGEALMERLTQTQTDLETSRAAVEIAARALAAEFTELGLQEDADFVGALAGAAAEAAAADQRAQDLRARLDAGRDLQARTAAAERARDLARRVASDLQPSRFLAYLLEEERAALADLGSVHLEDLTNGAYRFTEDDSFHVLDMNAGGTERTADSLSGGETFLASLALALALAEMVARGGGRLDSFFLDEGFGSLDPEHLERAMDGIGRLVADASGRLVVLVSHVEQMRHLLDDLIVLDKDTVTGQTRVLSGASPA